DSIPTHLVTREALAVYLKHMRPNGIVAFHVTNRYLDLPPVVQQIADAAGMKTAFVSHDPNENDERYSRTDWIMLTRDESFLTSDLVKKAASTVKVPAGMSLWTDDFNNLLRILK